ncbi:MAG: helix-turn-helix domain-containing protein [Hyphomonadaceae bacterium]|nr:helix-turn-helix domain-containing protein [Hyphomonadaceae bacterium]
MGSSKSSGKSVGAGAITPLLIGVQTHPERDVSLESLAREAGYSPSHFHRLFTETIGETPKEHVERVRLERAALKIAVTRDTILDISLSVGFRNHETFTRAFKRAFGMTPSACRRGALAAQHDRMNRMRAFRGDGCTLSEVTFLTLKPMTLLAMRRVGPYATVDLPPFSPADQLWSALVAFAESRKLAYRRLPMSICPDDPNMTAPDRQNLDACIPLVGEGKGRGNIRRLDFPGGLFGAIEHRGPYATIDQAYRTLADGIRRSGRFAFRDGPPLQIFRELSPDGDPAKNLTEVYFPVEKVS